MLKELGNLNPIMASFTWPTWTGGIRWPIYVNWLGFYHLKFSLSIGLSLDLEMLLDAEIKKHAI